MKARHLAQVPVAGYTGLHRFDKTLIAQEYSVLKALPRRG